MTREKAEDETHHGNDIPLRNLGKEEEGLDAENDETHSMTSGDQRTQRKPSNIRKWVLCLTIVLVLLTISLGGYYAYVKYFAQKESDVTLKEAKSDNLRPPNPVVPLPPSASVLHVYEKSAVCSDSGICSKIGRDIFQRGGNVIDATVATLLCNGITTLQSLGIGGGFIMNVYIKGQNRAFTVNARETAPLAATENMFVGKPKGISMQGPLSIGVPGEIKGYSEVHKRFGSMSWREIIEPTIKVCDDGFPLTKHMSDALNANQRVKNDARLRSVFVHPITGEYHPIGTYIFPPKELCNTYRTLATYGGNDFYNGSLARMIAEDLKEIGSIITLEDLKSYTVDWIDSVPLQLGNKTVHLVPPAGSGTIVGFILNILNGYNFTEKDLATPEATALTYHRMIESFKFAFGKRAELGDMRFNNLSELLHNLTSLEYGEEIRKLIDDKTTYHDIGHYNAKSLAPDNKGTSHLSVIAPNGDAVSVTSTINYYFGSGHSGRQTGIIFNSCMDDFSTPGYTNYFGIPSSKPNYIQPGKRPLSSMSPTIITNENGDVILSTGSAGGSKIITAVATTIARILWFKDNVKQALDAPRIHDQLIPDEVQYEFGIIQDILDGLKSRGHNLERSHARGSAMCAIQRDENSNILYANADYRKQGEVAGF